MAKPIRDLIINWYYLIIAYSNWLLDEKWELATLEFMKTNAGLQLAI